ncbi:hypothetical protein ACQKNS_18755 [Peribacillus sp. NPDC094092]|uniref:hypothetical protein n=1 Tax=Peribacillus sp. NPDC094092 TaxID=3390611 RepID=UPI003D035FE7
MKPENMKTPLAVLKKYLDFPKKCFTCNSTKNPPFKLNPLFKNYFIVCSEVLPYKDIYKAYSMFPHEYHKQMEHQKRLVLAEREKSKYEFLVKGTEAG